MADGFVSLLLIVITGLLNTGTNARFANVAKGNAIAAESNQGAASVQGVNEGKQQNKLEYDNGYFGPNHQSPYYNYKGNFEVPWNKKNFKQELNSGYERMKKLRKDVLSKILNKNRVLRIPPKRKHPDGFHVRKRRQVLQAYLIRDGGRPLASNTIKIDLDERRRQPRIIWPDLPSEYDEIASDRIYSVGSLEQWFNYPLTTPAHPNPAWHLPTLCREYKPEQTRVKRAAKMGIKERRRKREKKKLDKKRRRAKKKVEKMKKLAKKRKKKKKGKGGKRKSPKPRVRTSNATQEFESISIPDSDWTRVKTDEEDASYYSDLYEEIEEEITNEEDKYNDKTVNNKNKTKDNKNKANKKNTKNKTTQKS